MVPAKPGPPVVVNLDSVVGLAGAHESAYPDHCRTWAPTVSLFADLRGRLRFS